MGGTSSKNEKNDEGTGKQKKRKRRKRTYIHHSEFCSCELQSNGKCRLFDIKSKSGGKFKITEIAYRLLYVNTINELERLLASGVNLPDNLLNKACGAGASRVIIEALLKDARFDPAKNDSQCLRNACATGNVDTIRVLLEDGRVDAGALNNECIRKAAMQPLSGKVELLLMHGSGSSFDPSANNNAALRNAVASFQIDNVRLLMCDKRVHTKDCSAALMLAIESNNHEMVNCITTWVRNIPTDALNRAKSLARSVKWKIVQQYEKTITSHVPTSMSAKQLLEQQECADKMIRMLESYSKRKEKEKAAWGPKGDPGEKGPIGKVGNVSAVYPGSYPRAVRRPVPYNDIVYKSNLGLNGTESNPCHVRRPVQYIKGRAPTKEWEEEVHEGEDRARSIECNGGDVEKVPATNPNYLPIMDEKEEREGEECDASGEDFKVKEEGVSEKDARVVPATNPDRAEQVVELMQNLPLSTAPLYYSSELDGKETVAPPPYNDVSNQESVVSCVAI